MGDHEERLLALSYAAGTHDAVRVRVFHNEEEMYQYAAFETSSEEYLLSADALLDERFRSSERPKPIWRQKTRTGRVSLPLAQQVGNQLWDVLPPAVKDLIRASQDELRPLRIKMCSKVQPLLELPWEWLAIDGKPLPIRDGVRLVRSVPTRYASPPSETRLPLRVLVVITNPKDESLLDIGAELAAVTAGLRIPNYELSVVDEPTLETLASELASRTPHIVHYIGHAGVSEGDGNLVVHAGQSSRWIDQTTLSRALPPCVRLLCLSTCFTQQNYQIAGFERIALGPGVIPLPTAIVNRYPVGKVAVQTFWSTFYPELIAQSGDVIEASRKAQQAVFYAVADHADWSSFAVVVRDNSGKPIHLTDTAADPRLANARQIQAQFKTSMLNEIAEQMNVLGSDAPESVRKSLSNVLDRVSKIRTEE